MGRRGTPNHIQLVLSASDQWQSHTVIYFREQSLYTFALQITNMARFKKGSAAAKRYMAKLRRLAHKKRKHSKPRKRKVPLKHKIKRAVNAVKHPMRAYRRYKKHHRSHKKRKAGLNLTTIAIAGALVGSIAGQFTNPSSMSGSGGGSGGGTGGGGGGGRGGQNPIFSAFFKDTNAAGEQEVGISWSGFNPNTGMALKVTDTLDSTNNQTFFFNNDANGNGNNILAYSADSFSHTLVFVATDQITGNSAPSVSVTLPAGSTSSAPTLTATFTNSSSQLLIKGSGFSASQSGRITFSMQLYAVITGTSTKIANPLDLNIDSAGNINLSWTLTNLPASLISVTISMQDSNNRNASTTVTI